MDIKKILVPIDGSDASERAFSYAVAFAKKTAAELILLYVVDAEPKASGTAESYGFGEEEGRGYSGTLRPGRTGRCEGEPYGDHRCAGVFYHPHG